MSYVSKFETDGYFVVPELLSVDHCNDLLREIVQCFRSSEPTVIKEPDFRRHSPLPLSDAVGDALTSAVEHGHGVLSNFLENEQELVELSSITVFPNAAEQPLHRDEANEGHFLASVFINLAATREEAGALLLVPGSHRLEVGGAGAPIAVEVPQGSAVFMNSKLLHGGGANTSTDSIRSVFYFTMGEPNLYGPPYSIRDEVKAQHLVLDEFQPRLGQRRIGWSADSRPQLRPDCQLLLPLSGEHEEVVLAHKGRVCRRRVLEEREEYLLDVLQRIECHPRELQIRDLASLCSVDEAELLAVLSTLARDGWVCW